MSSKYCTYCGSREHNTDLCPKTWGGQIARAHLYCSYCGSNQHTVKYCPKTWSGPSNRRANPNGNFID